MNKKAKIIVSIVIAALLIAVCVLSYFAFFNKDEDKDMQNDSSSSVSKEEKVDKKDKKNKETTKEVEDKLTYREVCVKNEYLCFKVPNGDGWVADDKVITDKNITHSILDIKNDAIKAEVTVNVGPSGFGSPTYCAVIDRSEIGSFEKVDSRSINGTLKDYVDDNVTLEYRASTVPEEHKASSSKYNLALGYVDVNDPNEVEACGTGGQFLTFRSKNVLDPSTNESTQGFISIKTDQVFSSKKAAQEAYLTKPYQQLAKILSSVHYK